MFHETIDAFFLGDEYLELKWDYRDTK